MECLKLYNQVWINTKVNILLFIKLILIFLNEVTVFYLFGSDIPIWKMMNSLTIACVFAQLLVARANQDLELSNAANDRDLDKVTKALASGANPNWQSQGGGWPMVTALIKASAKNHVDIVSALLDAGADPNLREYRGITALNEAAYHGSVDVVPILISHGADVDAYGQNTPLMRTIHLNQVKIARVLLYHGADPKRRDSQGKTVADRARERGHYELANLIENFDVNSVTIPITVSLLNSSPTAPTDKIMPIESTNNNIKLFNAAKEGNLPLVIKTLALGANVNWRNPTMNGKTTLMIASHRNDAEIVLALLTAGADPNLHDNSGNGPLHQAAYYGSVDVLRILISNGADVNLKNIGGFTALTKTAHIECAGHWIETARILLLNGADRNLKEMHGRTTADLARSRGFIKLANFIDNFDMNSVTTEPAASTSELRSPVSITPSNSKGKPISSTASQIYITSTSSDLKLDSSTMQPAQISPNSTSSQLSSISSCSAHNLSLPIVIIIACVLLIQQ